MDVSIHHDPWAAEPPAEPEKAPQPPKVKAPKTAKPKPDPPEEAA